MKTFIRFTANFIIAFGLIPVLGGILTIIGWGNFIQSIPLFGSNPNLFASGLSLINAAAGIGLILSGLVFMAFGEGLFIFNELVDHVRKMEQNKSDTVAFCPQCGKEINNS